MKTSSTSIFSALSARLRHRGLRIAVVGGMVLTLANCAAFTDPNGFFAKASPFNDQTPWADYALAAIARNDIQAAEAHADRALTRNPKDPYALLAAGIVYQNTGRPFRAKQMYQEVMSVNPALSANVQSWSRLSPAGLADIAANNLQVLEVTGAGADSWPRSAGMPGGLPANTAAPMPGATPPGPGMGGSSWAQPPMGAQQSAAMPQSGMGVPQAIPNIGLTEADQNAVNRFKVLRRLLDEGLVTDEEFQARRNANVGALTPLTAAPPSAGLDRPVPPADQIVSRLAALRRALEMRAITAREHSVERTMILDALLPSQPLSLAGPATPPDGIMDAAAAVRRLETLKEANLINSDEMTRERESIERGLGMGRGGAPMPTGTSPMGAQPQPLMPGAMGTNDNPFASAQPQPMNGTPGQPQMLVPSGNGMGDNDLDAPQKDMSLLSGMDMGGPGVHLASYSSRRSAEASVAEFKRRFGSQLSSLDYSIKKTNIPGKGTYYRLIFGPVGSGSQATSLCREIKRRGQYCAPMDM